jgi:hypothetical protein
MCGYQGIIPVFCFQLPDQFYILIFESPGMLALAHADAFNGFNKEIAEMPVEFSRNPVNFGFALFGKRQMEVSIYNLFPVSDHIKIDEIKKIGNPVNQPERDERDKPGKTK